MNIKIFRNSICAADDANFHGVEFDINVATKLKDAILFIEDHKEYKGYGGGIWAGSETNFKTIRTNKGKWKINNDVSLKDFFFDIKPFIRFERNSNKCKD